MYDVIIIGAGPAGLSAGIYAGRGKLKTLILEYGMEGGQMGQTLEVANYPGVIEGETGMDLALRMSKQAKSFGAEIKMAEAKSIRLEGSKKIVETDQGNFESKAVIVATGTKSRKLGVPGEEEYAGRGVSYCATCDGPFYSGAEIFVIGGGDAAVEEAIYLTRFAKKVHIVHRRDELRAEAYLEEMAKNNEKIDFFWSSELAELKGSQMLEEVSIRNKKTGEVQSFHKDEVGPLGVFIYVGNDPQTAFVSELVENEKGYIVTDSNQETSVKGIYAAGDICKKKVRQVINSASEGAIAAISAIEYLERNE
ncbi:thioredoxin-disulfide reductase [Peptoniphilus sp. KCTC 25270]|uniref:thioredoxin-disulfide reductase n=1 Tax=Peptoniphilus sp. KCTC 25270 TaxID=2897414 RepID=UPI001E439D5F|nr:thioredoxin-disulfide reductase [Peptoniphilus sp. KCTC 25270]MCD1146511.1 thioredoxin-disulfide reductase [Peptoniphilus sp. KCTC 25270]